MLSYSRGNRRPFKQPTTKGVILFKRELITALTKCPDPRTEQGYAYIIETKVEYQTRTVSKRRQTATPTRPTLPLGNNSNSAWKAFEIEQATFKEYQHYTQQALEVIDITFPGFLDKPNGHLLPKGLKPKQALNMVEALVKDSVVSQQLGNNLIRDVLDRTYKPNQNGPRDYFIESDDDIRMSQNIGTQPILPTMVMAAAQQAFMNSGHQKDKIRAINEQWSLKKVNVHHHGSRVPSIQGILHQEPSNHVL